MQLGKRVPHLSLGKEVIERHGAGAERGCRLGQLSSRQVHARRHLAVYRGGQERVPGRQAEQGDRQLRGGPP